MATNFPTSLDSFTNPASGNFLNSPDHASEHANANDAIAALETKVGIASSAVTTTHDYKLSGVTGSDKAASKTGTEILTNKTLTSPVVRLWDGWEDANESWTYSSVSGTTGVITVPSDATTKYQAGMRVKFTQTTVKYAIITAVATTSLTVYTGTDYTLANAAISANYYSNVKGPFGFPLDWTKWTVEVTDTSSRSQATPTATTWYNVGSISITIPIGLWNVEYSDITYLNYGSVPGGAVDQYSTLSTANNSESDNDFTGGVITTAQQAGVTVTRRKILTIAASTPYYLNTKTTAGGFTGSINIRGDIGKTIIRAISAYL